MSVASTALRRAPAYSLAVARRLEALRPLPWLTALAGMQLAQAFWFAFSTPHNAWIWYSGGDSTSYWTEQWAIGHLIFPQAVVGYALPVYYAWVPLVAGPSLLNGAEIIVLFQAIVLVPLALVLFWAVADRIFGRVFAWVAALLWIVGPLLLLHGFVERYHWVFDQLFLVPHWFGFTNMADLPSLVVVLACVWLTLRAVDRNSDNDAVLAGLVGGLALGVKPSNAFILPAVAVLLLAVRRPRQIGLWAAGLAPSLLILLIWKARGLGYVPATSSSYAQTYLAAGAAPIALTTTKYLPFDLHHFGIELSNLREYFWSLRFLEFLVIAGAFGAIKRAPAKGLFVVVWFASYGIVKASSPRSDFPSATYYRLVEPALPAFILLALAVVYCLPRTALGTPRAVAPAPLPRIPLAWRRLVPAVVVIAVIPLLLLVIAQPSSAMRVARDENTVQEAPISNVFHLKAKRISYKHILLTWRSPKTSGTKIWFVVYTSPENDGCSRPSSGANECFLNLPTLVVTQAHRFVDRPGPKLQYYRVAAVAQYQTANQGGDLMLLSPAAIGAAYSGAKP